MVFDRFKKLIKTLAFFSSKKRKYNKSFHFALYKIEKKNPNQLVERVFVI
jgi:hypothetical protein